MAVNIENKELLPTIIANCKRLLKDANLLLDGGSSGAAMSMAILAFEEAGKGHHVELSIPKTKRTPSWHQFRQVTASFVLLASVFQKYGIELPDLPAEAHTLLEERWKKTKHLSDLAKEPVPEELMRLVIEPGRQSFEHLDEDQLTLFQIEMRWAKKVFMAASKGEIESERQRGIYVDFDATGVNSNPTSVTRQEAYRWIRVVERVLLLLKNGDYKAPYGELAAVLEKVPRPLPKGEELVKLLSKLQAEISQAR